VKEGFSVIARSQEERRAGSGDEAWRDSELFDIIQKAARGERLGRAEALRCLGSRDLAALGRAADLARRRQTGDRVFYSSYLNVNTTNLCRNACPLCAFYRSEGDPGGYLLTPGEIRARVQKALREEGIGEVHIVGGIHPAADMSYAREVVSAVRSLDAGIFIKAFTAVEIAHFASCEQKSFEEALGELQRAGLNGLPGGGAEIFSGRVRDLIAPRKIGRAVWLEVHRAAHRIGLVSNAAMLYGHFETPEETVDHLSALRDLQDETRGFRAFVPLPFHPERTPFRKTCEPPDGLTHARIFSVARLFLDNFPHIKVHWPAFGLKTSQVLLAYGADDLGGTAGEERIFREAGGEAGGGMRESGLKALILETGRTPVLAASDYVPR